MTARDRLTLVVVALLVAVALAPSAFSQSVPGGGARGVASVTAGAGMSVSTTSGVATIANTGVTSMVAGSSKLTVSGAAGAITIDLGTALTPTSVAIGGGTAITKIVVYAPALTPTQIAAAIGAAEQTFSVSGLTTADKVIVDPPAGQTALCPMVSARVSGTNTLALSFANLAVALCTPVSGTYSVLAIRS